MSKFTNQDRHIHSVIEVARTLAGNATGSCSGEQADELKHLMEWLEWRITDGWNPPLLAYAVTYDASVMAMAQAALDLFMSQCVDPVNP